MPRIKIKTSSTPGTVPANGSLQQGELVANLADNKVWVGNASGNPVQLIDTIASQDSNSVNITGGSINNTAITATNLNTTGLTLTGERLHYDEGTNASAFTSNWNNSTTYTMADFGGLGSVNAHGWSSGPATYTLTLSGIPAHTEIRYQCFLHYVDSVDNETSNIYTMNGAGTETERLRMRKTYNVPPSYDLISSGTTVSWNGNRFYSYTPWGGNTVYPNGGGNGYVIMDTGWYAHSLSSFTARHELGANQAQSDEAQYISHVKVWIRGSTNTYTSIATTLSSGVSNALPTQGAVKSFIDTNLGTTNSFVKNVYVFTSNGTYTKSGSDVKKVRVICVGGGGGGRGYGESGGAGGYAERTLGAEAMSTVSVTVGGGGAGGNYFGNSPAGGTTSFGSYLSATGGFGANNHGSHIGGHGGVGSTGDVISYGGGGKGHNNGYNNPSNSAVGRGGAGFFGGSRNSHHSASRPADHGAPGGGGTGSVGGSGGSGSTGRDGICIVYELR
jgi:hypothetical protein